MVLFVRIQNKLLLSPTSLYTVLEKKKKKKQNKPTGKKIKTGVLT